MEFSRAVLRTLWKNSVLVVESTIPMACQCGLAKRRNSANLTRKTILEKPQNEPSIISSLSQSTATEELPCFNMFMKCNINTVYKRER